MKRKKKRSKRKHSQKKRKKNRKEKDRKRKKNLILPPPKPSLSIVKAFDNMEQEQTNYRQVNRIRRVLVFDDMIVSTETGCYITFWARKSGDILKRIRLDYSALSFVVCSDIVKWDEDIFMSYGVDEKIRFYDRRKMEIIRTVSVTTENDDTNSTTRNVFALPHRNQILVLFSNSNIRIFSYKTGQSIKFVEKDRDLGSVVHSQLSIVRRDDWLYTLFLKRVNNRERLRVLVQNYRTPNHPENSGVGYIKTFGNSNYHVKGNVFCVIYRHGVEIVAGPFEKIREKKIYILVFLSYSKKYGSSRHSNLLLSVPTNIQAVSCMKSISNRYLCLSFRKGHIGRYSQLNRKHHGNHGFLKFYDLGRNFNNFLQRKKRKSSGLKVYLDRKIHEQIINDFEIVKSNRMNIVYICTCSDDKFLKLSEVQMDLEVEDPSGEEWMKFDLKNRIHFLCANEEEMKKTLFGSDSDTESVSEYFIHLKVGGKSFCVFLFKHFLM